MLPVPAWQVADFSELYSSHDVEFLEVDSEENLTNPDPRSLIRSPEAVKAVATPTKIPENCGTNLTWLRLQEFGYMFTLVRQFREVCSLWVSVHFSTKWGSHLELKWSSWLPTFQSPSDQDRLFFDIVEKCWPTCESFLKRCKARGKKVLVNCKAGHNRSACMCAWATDSGRGGRAVCSKWF